MKLQRHSYWSLITNDTNACHSSMRVIRDFDSEAFTDAAGQNLREGGLFLAGEGFEEKDAQHIHAQAGHQRGQRLYRP